MLQALGKNYTAERFVLDSLRKIPGRYSYCFLFYNSSFYVEFFSDLEAALLLLPFDYVQKLLSLLVYYLDRFQSPELCIKCAVFLIK